MNSAVKLAFFRVSSSAFKRKFFNYSPSCLFTNIAGILIPWPVPSSESTRSSISSFLLSIMMARAPPFLSIFLAYYTKEHFPISTKIIGDKILSGSPDQSSEKGILASHPSGFDSL